MCMKFSFLKANEKYAQYWYKETPKAEATNATPKKHAYRSVFACDRDRVMYCSAFRCLSSKTQVFNSQTSDHLRTRLTHTLEVAQIARTIARELGLDEELVEAIALGHDVGHTPFGHVGERTLNTFSVGDDKRQVEEGIEVPVNYQGFKHNQQSVRVLVEYSENVKFSNFMLFGVREHSKLCWKDCADVAFYDMYKPYCSYGDGRQLYPAWSFEAFIVKWADEIAQRHHDIEDAFLQKIIPADDIVEKVRPLSELSNDENLTRKFDRLKEETDKLKRKDFSSYQYAFAHTLSSFIVDAYVTILIKELSRVLHHFCNMHNVKSAEDFQREYLNLELEEVRTIMKLKDAKIYQVDKILGQSLKYGILDSYEVQRMDGKGAYIIRKLIRAYASNPQQLPNDFINRFIKVEIDRLLDKEALEQFLDVVQQKVAAFPRNVSSWKDYECREALRIITNDADWMKTTYPALLRVIFDYISSMTDASATKQRVELY